MPVTCATFACLTLCSFAFFVSCTCLAPHLALLTLLTLLAPMFLSSSSQLDSKKELEKQLKGVCEAFIMAVTKVRPKRTFRILCWRFSGPLLHWDVQTQRSACMCARHLECGGVEGRVRAAI